MSIIIYQILGKIENYKDVNFNIKEKDFLFKSNFISEVIYNCYKSEDKDIKVIFIIPQSLNTDFTKLIKLESIKEDFKLKIKTKAAIPDFDILIINSIGTYKLDNNINIDFENFPNNIAVQIFIDLVKRIDQVKDNVKIFFDISTGHNIYVLAIMEAMKAIIVREKLRSNLKGGRIKARFTLSEPIIGGVEKDEYKIYINDFDVKAFFDLPFNYQEIQENSKLASYVRCDGTLKKDISKENEDLTKKIQSLLENLLLAYNAIKYNIPLVFYYDNLINLKIEDFEEEVIKKFSAFLMPSTKDHKVYSYELDENKIFNLFYSFSLYKLIKDSLSSLNKSSTEDIKKLFTKIYSELNLGLNIRFLERDLKEIENKKEYINENKWIRLDELVGSDNKKNSNKNEHVLSDEKRNFFAHSGLERTMVFTMRDKDLIYIKYNSSDSNVKDKIYNWLKKPEG